MEGKLKERSLTPTKKKGGESFKIGQGGAHKFMQSEINLHKLKKMTISAKMVHIWSLGYIGSYDLNLWKVIYFSIIYFVNGE